MDDYLSKPLRLEDLEAVLTRWLPPAEDGAKDDPKDAFDASRLDDLQRDLSPELVRDLIRSFLDTSPGLVEWIAAAAKASDSETAAHAAHRLRGGCLAVGATKLADTCQALESAHVKLGPAASAVEQAWRATEPPLRRRLA